jgi:hypothetical protein
MINIRDKEESIQVHSVPRRVIIKPQQRKVDGGLLFPFKLSPQSTDQSESSSTGSYSFNLCFLRIHMSVLLSRSLKLLYNRHIALIAVQRR